MILANTNTNTLTLTNTNTNTNTSFELVRPKLIEMIYGIWQIIMDYRCCCSRL